MRFTRHLSLAAAPSELRCGDCGLVYSRAAIAREITLSMGTTCRRCGGTLHESGEPPVRRAKVTAARSAVGGLWRHPLE